MSPILEVRNLVKRYGTVTAVDDVSFHIARGACFGLLGPNGAGKTTTIEISEGIQDPTAGEILYMGAPRTPRYWEEIGIQFQSTALLDFLSVKESIETFRRLYRKPLPLRRLVDFCQLEDILEKRNDRISGGQRQRLLVAIALVNDPTLLFLDEPTTGLDPQARRHLWSIVETIKAEGKTVVLTTHYMEEAQFLCDEIAIIDRGQIIKHGKTDRLLREDCCQTAIRLPKSALTGASQKTLTGLERDGIVHQRRDLPDNVEFVTVDVNRLLDALRGSRVDLTDVHIRSKNLEDIFLELTGRQLRD